MKEQRAIFLITILKKITEVYFNTFFVFYFFKVANYEVLPLAKYYITLYFFTGLGFFLIRSAMKKSVKVPYFRIGISMQALYITLILLLKDKIIDWIILVGLVNGMADALYYYPKNILDSEKIDNESRQKYSGLVNIISRVMGIIIPMILGVALTFLSYTDVGKVFFVLFVIMFFVSLFIKEEYKPMRKVDLKSYIGLIKKNKSLRSSFIVPFLSGLTYSSGVMGVVITLLKINNFKSNFNLGVVDSICAGLALICSVLFALKIKPQNFNKIQYISGILSFLALCFLGIYPSIWTLIIYLIVRFSALQFINLITSNKVTNLSNSKEVKEHYKAEYYLTRDLAYAISRCFGYVILLLVCILFGMDYISYILILPAVSILLEAIVSANINDDETKKTTA